MEPVVQQRACDGEWWIVRQAETLGGERRGHHALIIDAHDRRERVSWARAMITSAASRGSDDRNVSARSPIAADIAAARSEATVTATPNSRAAAMKSGAR
jgi:hypothetical protein